jgi:hypothetical protein
MRIAIPRDNPLTALIIARFTGLHQLSVLPLNIEQQLHALRQINPRQQSTV